MRLVTAGIPSQFSNSVVGTVTREPLPRHARTSRILATDSVPKDSADLAGYSGFLTTAKLESQIELVPTIHSVREIEHLRPNYIVAMEPRDGFIRTLYRPDSRHNVIVSTERCNSNCLMCSQPPQDHDDVDAMTERNLKVIQLIEEPPEQLIVSGGEPTLLCENLLSILKVLKERFPETNVLVLSNGRAFAWSGFASRVASVEHPGLIFGIPLYSDDSRVHDYVVQAKGAFDQTIMGFHQLARYGIRSEVRVVLHAITIPRLPQLAEYIYRNLTFVEHVALMGLENIGYAPRNMESLWIDPHDYQDQLESAVEILSTRSMNVSIYNHQLCVLRKSLWKFARKSISDWKNIYLEECESCGVQADCGGFFQWATKLHSNFVHPLPAEEPSCG
jgi:His-Xaa-Ser system radical SAM maturase HxsC